MAFTDRDIQGLKPKAKRYDKREKSRNGFAVRVTPHGKKTFLFFYTFEGVKRRMTLGTYSPTTPGSLANAHKKHRAALAILESGKDPALVKKNEKLEAISAPTINNLIDEYIEKWAKPNKRSWKEDLRMLTRDIKPVWGKRKAKDVTKRDVILLLEGIQERGAPIAANRTLACIRRMFNFAVERDILQTTPCLSVKALSKENRRARCLTLDEIKKFWHGIDTDNAAISPATKLALKLQLVTAQRKGEIIGAKWSELELDTDWWTIPGEKAKNGLDHRVPLSPLALELLHELKRINGKSRWLFPSPKKGKHTIAGESVAYAIRRSNEADAFQGAAAFTPHDLRRTAASHMTGMGIPRLVVSKILNHADRETTAVYDRHSYDAEKKHALDAWGNKLSQLINDIESANNVVNLGAAYKNARSG